MSTWNLGANDVSEETHNYRNRLSSKDTQIAALQSQLAKQAAEFSELKQTLNEALHKLSAEADRALRLDKDLSKCSEDLGSEKLIVQNLESTLASTHQQLRAKDLEARELQATLESISHQSDGFKMIGDKLQQEKRNLEYRVRELEANIQHLNNRAPSPVRKRQRRSSSLSDFVGSSLQTELDKCRASLAKKDADLLFVNEKLASLQTNLVNLGNERIAVERTLKSQLKIMEDSLQEKEEELQFFKHQQGDESNTREEELLRRIDEDQAKISALEMMLRDNRELTSTKEALRKAEQKLRTEAHKFATNEARLIELVRQKEEALDELDNAREQIVHLTNILREKETRIDAITEREKDLAYRLLTFTVNGLRDDSAPASLPDPAKDAPSSLQDSPQKSANQMAADHISRLLAAIDRLRNERDDLRRHVEFLEIEAKFSAAPPTYDSTTSRVDSQPALQETTIHTTFAEENKTEFSGNRVSEELASLQRQLQERDANLAELEDKLEVVAHGLADATAQRDALQSRVSLLESRDDERLVELQRLNNAHREIKDLLACAESNITEITASFEEVQSERNSLALQLTNLQTDLCNAQEDLAEAEQRYGSLQRHQLSSMSSNEVIQSLREQIGELEGRVLRRTEQIGIHQHDIKRLETNLRLHEERIAEMTSELDTLSAQKEAMVEDCADAREARDEALQKVEGLEMELEELEGKTQTLEGAIQSIERSRDIELSTLVCIVAQAIGETRTAKQAMKAAVDRDKIVDGDTSTDDIRSITVAFALSQHELKRTVRELGETYDLSSSLQDRLAILQAQRDDAHSLATQQAKQVRDLESRLQDLHNTMVEMESNHNATVKQMTDSTMQLEARLAEAERMGDQDIQVQLSRLRDIHAEELAAINGQLTSTIHDLDHIRQQHSEITRLYQEALSSSSSLRQEIELSSRTSTDRSRICEKLGMELSNLRAQHATEILHLQQRLDSSVEEARQCQNSLDALRSDYQQCLDKSARVEKDYEGRLALAMERSQADKHQLENELATSASQLAIIKARYDTCCEAITELERQLQEEVNCRNAEREDHEKELASLSESSAKSELNQAKLQEEVDIVRDELDRTKLALETTQKEKEAMNLEMTNREAEIQRSMSLGRYLESQVKDSERTIASLKETLERTRAELSASEKSGKAAEISLSLNVAQHERTMATLQRELAALRSKPNLEETVARLEERHQEMEESLRNKCAEIEENDDRIIEMLKEKKKLVTKIDNLTRKVQNLQSKLAAGPAPQPPLAPESKETKKSPQYRVKPFTDANASTSPHTPAPPHISDPVTPTDIAVLPGRAVSGPSALTAKSRVSKLAARARISDPPPSSSLGMKRKIPDEYEEVVPPVQGFSVECLPVNDVGNTTPRRRLPQSNSGFTPIRSRPPVSPPKPSGNARVPLSVSNTNSPRRNAQNHDPLAKPSKRTWLGKIKGAKMQAASGTNPYAHERARGDVL